MDARPNPAWTQRLLATEWDRLERLVGPAWMPQTAPAKRGRGKAVEYGSGHFGTVMPTHDPDVVVKVTSDPDEARLVAVLLTLDRQLPGVVRYHRIVRLPGERQKRPVFVLWRQAARLVGNIGKMDCSGVVLIGKNKDHEEEAVGSLEHWVQNFREACKSVRTLLRRVADPAALVAIAGPLAPQVRFDLEETFFDDLLDDAETFVGTSWDGPFRHAFVPTTPRHRSLGGRARGLALVLRLLDVTARDWIANNPCGRALGEALGGYLQQGILLADVHDANLGVVTDAPGRDAPVITDPGHPIFLTHAYDHVAVPTL